MNETVLENKMTPNGDSIRMVMINDEPWFVVADICSAIEYSNPTMAVKKLSENDVRLCRVEGVQRSVNITNRSGFYKLMLYGKKKKSADMIEWLSRDVLPYLSANVTPAMPAVSNMNTPMIMSSDKYTIMHNMISAMQEIEMRCASNEQAIKDTYEAARETQEIVTDLQRRVVKSPPLGAMTCIQIAANCGLYSKNAMPHASLIAAVAKECGVIVRHALYNSPYSCGIYSDVNGAVVPVVYVKERGIEMIANWLAANFDHCVEEEFYKVNTSKHKAGDFKSMHHKIGKRKFNVYNEKGEQIKYFPMENILDVDENIVA